LGAPLEVLVVRQIRREGRGGPEGAAPRASKVARSVRAALPALLGALIAVAARHAVLGADQMTPAVAGISTRLNPLAGASLEARLANVPLLLLVYLQHLVLPTALAPDYGGTFLPLAKGLEPRVAFRALGALAALAVPTILCRSSTSPSSRRSSAASSRPALTSSARSSSVRTMREASRRSWRARSPSAALTAPTKATREERAPTSSGASPWTQRRRRPP